MGAFDPRPLTLELPRARVYFALLEIGGKARLLRPGSSSFEPLGALDDVWAEVCDYDDQDELPIRGPLSFRVGDGPVIELPDDGALCFGGKDGAPICSLLDRDRACVADYWQGRWRRTGSGDSSPTILIGQSELLFAGGAVPPPEIAAPGTRSRPSGLAERR